MQVRILQAGYVCDLEDKINLFLKKCGDKHELIDIKFNSVKSGACAIADETYYLHTALIILK